MLIQDKICTKHEHGIDSKSSLESFRKDYEGFEEWQKMASRSGATLEER